MKHKVTATPVTPKSVNRVAALSNGAAKSQEVEVHFVFERETKNCIRFAELASDPEKQIVGTIYIKKSVAQGWTGCILSIRPRHSV